MSQHQRIACLWFPNWPIQRRVVSQPELRKQRVVLSERDARRGQLVAAASPLAQRAGVAVAMPLAEAKSLLQGGQRPGEFHILPHEPQEDVTALESLADSLESHSPIVGIESFDDLRPAKKHSPECIFMDVTGLAHLFGDEQQLAELTMHHCQQAGYLARMAIAGTVGMAWAMARYQHEPLSVLHGDDVKDCEALKARLPIAALRLPVETLDTLSQLGIVTVAQLERLPRAELAMRFGHAIGLRLDQLNGAADEPIVARRLPAEFQQHQPLDFPTHHRETIEVIATQMVQAICEQLRCRQRGALQWRFTLDRVEGEPIEFAIRLFRATATPADVLPLLTMHLEQALRPHTRRTRNRTRKKCTRKLTASNSKYRKLETEERKLESTLQVVRTMNIDIRDVTIAVTASSKLAQHQRRLFDENPHADPQAMTLLINRLTTRVGANNVVCAKLQSNAQPEYSFRMQPLVETRLRRTNRKRKNSHLFARPFRLFHPPRPLQATSIGKRHGNETPPQEDFISGTNISRPPALLCYEPQGTERAASGQGSQRVVRVWGPERIETGWWRGRTTCRDYWRVETDGGAHLWVFRDLKRKRWFVQGEF